MGLMGMAQVIATIAYGIQGLRRGKPPGIGLISMPIRNKKPWANAKVVVKYNSFMVGPLPGNRQQMSRPPNQPAQRAHDIDSS